MQEEKDFMRNRLVPFFIGLGVSIGFSALYAVLYSFAFALTIAGSFGVAQTGSPIGALAAIPLWLFIIAVSLAFWVLTTWLLGKWAQEKYHAYKGGQNHRRAAREGREREARFAAKRREEAAEKQFKQEAEWEKEWNMMKKQEKRNFSSEKREKSASSNMALPPVAENRPVKEEE